MYIDIKKKVGSYMTLNEIEKYVIENNAFSVYYDSFKNVGYSAGVLLAIENNKDFSNEVEISLNRFENNDFGTMYDVNETVIQGSEYGCYNTSIGELFLHAENSMIVVYFYFER